MPKRTVIVDVEICRTCKKEMARSLASEVGVERYGNDGECSSCARKTYDRKRVRRASILKGAVIEKVRTDGIGRGAFDGLVLVKGKKRYEVWISCGDIQFTEEKNPFHADGES